MHSHLSILKCTHIGILSTVYTTLQYIELSTINTWKVIITHKHDIVDKNSRDTGDTVRRRTEGPGF